MVREKPMPPDPTLCPHCHLPNTERHDPAEVTCMCVLATCGHLLSPETDDDPPCEQCDCCPCDDNDFKAGLRGE